MPRLWARLVLRLAGARVRLEGMDRVDWSEPVVIVANHQSWFDVFTLAAYLPARARFVAKQELGRIPIFGAAWKACGHISVDRADRSRAIESLQEASRRVRDEKLAVILFPEGTRSPDGRLQPFKKGAFVLALETGVPVVPIAILGTREIMPKGSFRIRSGEVRVRVGEPIPVEGMGLEARGRLLEQSRSAVAALLEGAPTDPDEDGSGERSGSPEARGEGGSGRGGSSPSAGPDGVAPPAERRARRGGGARAGNHVEE